MPRWIASACVFSTLVTLAPAAAAKVPRAAEEDRAAEAEAPSRRPVALTVNPLAFAIQRYGGNVELVPIPHHAVVISAYVQSVPVTLTRRIARTVIGPVVDKAQIRDGVSASPGGEIGYRLYSGSRGASGVFVGASFDVTPLAYARLVDGGVIELSPLYAVGGSLDVGAQLVTSFGLTVGGGLGVMALAYSLPSEKERLPMDFAPHILPRVLFATGWSF